MINAKQKMVITNVFHRLGVAALIGAAWLIGFEVFFDFLGLIINQNLASFWVGLQAVPHTLTWILNLVLFAYFLLTPYGDFKWSIQNGISRKTMWQGRLIALLLSSLLVYLVDVLLSLTDRPFNGWQDFGVSFLALLTGVLTFQAIGNGFGLLNRKWKVIVGIGLPIAFVLLCMALIKLIIATGDQFFGYQHNHFVGVFSVLNSSAAFWVCWVIYLVVVLLLTKVFNNHLQLRRD